MGAGYTLSWDLVIWLGQNRNDYNKNVGGEDHAIGEMLRSGEKGKIFVKLEKQVIDHPSTGPTDWTREYGEDVILVHQLKDYHLQGDAIEYFLGEGRFASHVNLKSNVSVT
jgi:hypothetical protein